MNFQQQLKRYAFADKAITLCLGVFAYAVGVYFLATIYL